MRRNKRAIVGDLISMFIATIIVFTLLLAFIFGSSLVKAIRGDNNGLVVLDEERQGIGAVFNYLPEYSKVIELKLQFLQEKKSFGVVDIESTGEKINA